MKIITKASEIRDVADALRRQGKRIGLIPTMGALHEGHMHLMRTIRPHCDVRVLWVFLNPTQFNSPEDYEKYPQDPEGDMEKAKEEGIDIFFGPSVEEIYPAGLNAYAESKSVRVRAGSRSKGLCGASRPGHFDGVVHVVSVFFSIIRPDVAVFGEKDYQQLMVINQLVEDLNLGIEILAAPLLRDDSGLALSSRNQLLEDGGEAALTISRSLLEAAKSARQGERSAEKLVSRVKSALSVSGLQVDYVELVDPVTLDPIEQVHTSARLCVAAFSGKVRLIDNIEILADPAV